MRNETLKYILGFLAAIVLIVVVIVLLVRNLVSTPSSSSQLPVQTSLLSYANTATTMQLTIDSPEVAPQDHHDIIVNVGRDETILTVTEGYDGNVVRSRTYATGENAYTIFLRSLLINGFTQGNANPNVKDERGHCALGDRFVYEIVGADGQPIQRYWESTCGSGTFNGDGQTVRRLFRTQVPDYSSLTNNIQL